MTFNLQFMALALFVLCFLPFFLDKFLFLKAPLQLRSLLFPFSEMIKCFSILLTVSDDKFTRRCFDEQ